MPLRPGADFMHPLTVGSAPHILARRDDGTAYLADLTWGMRLVVAAQCAVLVLVRYSRVLLPRAA
jgi:hypothetical protein